VVGRAAKLAAAGAIVGILAALVATRSLGSLLYGISATDPLTFLSVPLLFLVVAIAASYAPALRATRADPARALRAD
jgi:ABC-type antimicrobial peptide transport system permease subunit